MKRCCFLLTIAAVLFLRPFSLLGFDHLHLINSIRSSLPTDPKVKAAELDRDAAKERRFQAIAPMLPDLSASASHGMKGIQTATSEVSDKGATSLGLSMSLLLFDMKIFENRSQREKYVRFFDVGFEKARQDFILEAATIYLSLQKARDLLALSLENSKTIEQQSAGVATRFQAGEMTSTDMQQAETRYELANAQAIKLENDEKNLTEKYLDLFRNAPEAVMYRPELDMLRFGDVEEKSAVKRPDVAMERIREDILKSGLDIEKAKFFPTLSASGSLQKNLNSTIDPNLTYGATLSVNFDRIIGWERNSKILEASRLLASQSSQLERTERQAATELRQALMDLRSTARTLATYTKAIAAAHKALDGLNEELLSGTKTIVDVLDAQRDLYDSNTALITNRYDLAMKIVKSLWCSGTLTLDNLETVLGRMGTVK